MAQHIQRPPRGVLETEEGSLYLLDAIARVMRPA